MVGGFGLLPAVLKEENLVSQGQKCASMTVTIPYDPEETDNIGVLVCALKNGLMAALKISGFDRYIVVANLYVLSGKLLKKASRGPEAHPHF